MTSKYPLKRIFIILTLLFIFSCKQKEENFIITGKVNGDYTGLLFLHYGGERKDSILVKNGMYKFKGKVEHPIEASIGTEGISSSDENFFIENVDMTVDITIEEKMIREYVVNMIRIDTILGTEISKITYDYKKFKETYKADPDWNEKLYSKIYEIIKLNPNHRYSGSLLNEVSYDSVLNYKQLQTLYGNLNLEYQDSLRIKYLEYNIFPERRVKVGDLLKDFELPDTNEQLLSTKEFKGSLLLIDFWASWCVPCRKSFPELLSIAGMYEDRNFRVLGVSIDKDKDRWLNAIEKDKLTWVNVIDTGGELGKTATDFGIFAIPSNLLIDETGKIIAKDIPLKELEKLLQFIIK
jgi:thiol-disulfide isomerase/thioredoxin